MLDFCVFCMYLYPQQCANSVLYSATPLATSTSKRRYLYAFSILCNVFCNFSIWLRRGVHRYGEVYRNRPQFVVVSWYVLVLNIFFSVLFFLCVPELECNHRSKKLLVGRVKLGTYWQRVSTGNSGGGGSAWCVMVWLVCDWSLTRSQNQSPEHHVDTLVSNWVGVLSFFGSGTPSEIRCFVVPFVQIFRADVCSLSSARHLWGCKSGGSFVLGRGTQTFGWFSRG